MTNNLRLQPRQLIVIIFSILLAVGSYFILPEQASQLPAANATAEHSAQKDAERLNPIPTESHRLPLTKELYFSAAPSGFKLP